MRAVRAAAVLGAVVFSLAHVGSPDTIFEGQAGPYPIRVIVRTPLRPAVKPAQKSSTPMPTGVTGPMPVMTTLDRGSATAAA
jgi:hypothetical protein